MFSSGWTIRRLIFIYISTLKSITLFLSLLHTLINSAFITFN
nr:MAG TPA: hypothetical protein [Inoviridae sp.]